jgi:hypothetical protein
MTLTIPDDVRAKAELYVGDAAGQEKTRFLLAETGLPSGLLPLRDIVECGYVEETGFVWLKQQRKVDHYFAKADRHVSYGTEVSAVAENGRLKNITGVKAKEMLIWVSLHEICLDGGADKKGGNGKLLCKAIGGLCRSFPVEAFEAVPAEEEEEGAEGEKTSNAKEEDGAAAIDKVEEKLKELGTETVHAEAKN